jgi:penicillin-binding protein 1A
MMNKLLTRLAPLGIRLREFAATIPGRLRHPTWRGAGLGVAAIPVLLFLYVLVLIPFTPSINDLLKAKTAKPSVLMSADGKELAAFKRANRDWVKLGRHLAQRGGGAAGHRGPALLRPPRHRLQAHGGGGVPHAQGRVQGGSTITQQLARNLYPEEIGRAATMTRKLKEAITALKIEAVYSKDEILESYLNTVPFLYNAWGIEMAARTYFDKSAKRAGRAGSATLVGMLKGTSYYNPVTNPERALQRRNIVLAQMVGTGKLRTRRASRSCKAQPLKLDFERQPEQRARRRTCRAAAPLADRVGRAHDYNIYADGLVVRTTIDSRLQEMANEALERAGRSAAEGGRRRVERSNAGLAATPNYVGRAQVAGLRVLLEREPRTWYKAARAGGQADDQAIKAKLRAMPSSCTPAKEKTRLQAGFMAIEPGNRPRARLGGQPRFRADDQFDHVQQARRQPGSTFKPFVYGAAFETGTSRPTADGPARWRSRSTARGLAAGRHRRQPTHQPMTLRDGW